MSDTETLGDALPKQIARCQELLEEYKSIGPSGMFGYSMIKLDIDRAVKALASGDIVAMLQAYKALEDCK